MRTYIDAYLILSSEDTEGPMLDNDFMILLCFIVTVWLISGCYSEKGKIETQRTILRQLIIYCTNA